MLPITSYAGLWKKLLGGVSVVLLEFYVYKETTNQYSFHTEKAVSLLRKAGV